MKRIRHVIAIALCIGTSAQAQAQNAEQFMTTPIKWKGVEVVTNDFESIDGIRSAAGFPDGSVLLMSDPKLKATCTAVRTGFPEANVACSPLLSEDGTKTPQAWFVIEVDLPRRPPLRCIGNAQPLSRDLNALLEEWEATLSQALLAGGPIHERLNDARHLDYELPALSKLAQRIHASVKEHAGELEAAGASCTAEERRRAFYLMSFVGGDPRRFMGLATFHILDEDAGVANAATRFLMTFADFIDAAWAPRIGGVACNALDGPLATRNKSLVLLSKLKKRRALTLDGLSAECQTQIRNIARTSRAEIVAEPASELIM